MKKIFSAFLVAIIALTLITPSSTYAAVKLNTTELILNEGSTYTLKVTGTKSKVTWSSSNKKVATVNSKGKVTAKSPGTTNIVAKVNKKKYTCKLKVKAVFNADVARANIDGKHYDFDNGVVLFLKNNYSLPMELSANLIFSDSEGNFLGMKTVFNYYFEKDKECALIFDVPFDNRLKDEKSRYRYSVSLVPKEIMFYTSNVSDITTKYTIDKDNKKVIVEATNDGKETGTRTEIAVVFYKDKKIVGGDSDIFDVSKPGSSDKIKFAFPLDENNKTIDIDDCKVYVNYSYIW